LELQVAWLAHHVFCPKYFGTPSCSPKHFILYAPVVSRPQHLPPSSRACAPASPMPARLRKSALVSHSRASPCAPCQPISSRACCRVPGLSMRSRTPIACCSPVRHPCPASLLPIASASQPRSHMLRSS
ncbi:Unknown protein, partial [Striga hermonthica]